LLLFSLNYGKQGDVFLFYDPEESYYTAFGSVNSCSGRWIYRLAAGLLYRSTARL